jgi:hypothetical protein
MSTIRQLEIDMLKLRLMELQLEQEEKLIKYLLPLDILPENITKPD